MENKLDDRERVFDEFNCADALSDEAKSDIYRKTTNLVESVVHVQLFQYAYMLVKAMEEIGVDQDVKSKLVNLTGTLGDGSKGNIVKSFAYNFMRCLGMSAEEASSQLYQQFHCVVSPETSVRLRDRDSEDMMWNLVPKLDDYIKETKDDNKGTEK